MNIFAEERNVYGVYDKVEGLMKSNPVSINGMKVGQVKDLYFEKNYSGKIIVIMSLSTDFPIPKNSIANIFSSDLMGSKAIDIRLGDSDEYIKNGDTLFTETEAGLKEAVNKQVQPLKRKAENLIISIDSMVTTIQTIFSKSARENLMKSFESIETTFDNLKHSTYQIDTFLYTEKNNLSKIIYNIEELTGALMKNKENIDKTLINLESISDSLAKADITATFANAKRSLDELSDILEKINNAEGSAGKLINDKKLYEELVQTSKELKKLISDIEANPKKYVKFSLF